ncbi:oligogalacturonate-specific porin KdgM family protein [Buttiauxella sp. WJP83]|uniref:oligogalacturonate-specific porin KdgM family protein n=1 Tax=Buttiauxella sp. WJP83 TaxID=2986951 RepID=UPI0022DE85D8|nr:oligogalacturonate-specific porin KdgM family protein [Buttiauxella sp. WJP83]WBM68782.1 oligogalacturonate-specific porin KdgM family protein [Buttiauxella sp. WJP83]
MKAVLKMSAAALVLTSLSSSAVSIDYRHEYKADSKTNADRLKISHTTPSGYFASVEGKLAESTKKTSDGFNEGNGRYSGSGSEWELGKNFNIADNFVLAPALNLDNGDTAVGYRAQIKAIYKFLPEWVTTLRWRPGMQVDQNSDVSNKYYNQFNWEFGYNSKLFSVIGDFEYRFTNYEDYNGNHNYWLYNVVASYSVDKNWVPYTELGYVPRYNSDHDKDDHEMRYRLGIKYIF